jgi:hypothetical protein
MHAMSSSVRRIELRNPANDPGAPPEYIIQAIVDGLDHLATTMERKWGVGRLRLLVNDLLRAKFDAQKDKLDAAIESRSIGYIQAHAEGMRRAWEFLDKAAIEAGHKPLSPEIWECTLPASGEVVAIVRNETEAHHLSRQMRVFTLAEIARLIEALGDTVLGIKQAFPGSAITNIGKPEIDWRNGDAIPF